MRTKMLIGAVAVLVVGVVGAYLYFGRMQTKPEPLDPTPRQVTLSGTYECLPHLDTSGPQTTECAFGLVTDEGEHYAVNFGQSATAMEQFQAGAHIRAEGFVVIKEALSTDQWQKYNMKGIFTVTNMLEPAPTSGASAKINIAAVCEGALSYMTFPSGAAADTFVIECKEGKHPEVIERYKAQLGHDGAAI